MKVTSIEMIPVFVPFEATTRWHWGCREGANRLILKVNTDQGIVGWGETTSGAVNTLKSIEPLLIGSNPLHVETFLSKIQYLIYDSNTALEDSAGLEIAIWDIVGKYLGQPIHNLIGGRYRSKIPIALWCFYRYKGLTGAGGEDSPEKVAKFCKSRIEAQGFKTIKLKFGVMEPTVEVETVRAVRDAVGKSINIRIDPNGAWTLGTAINVIKQVEECNLEYIEDPIGYFNLDGMARIRALSRTPICANGSVHSHYDLSRVIHAKAADVVLSDVQMQGGIYNSKKLAHTAEAFGIGLSVHGSEYLGITMAALLHFISATPNITYAADVYYPHLQDDILKGGKLGCLDGHMHVPEGPGLGIEIDEKKVQEYNQQFNTSWQKLREKGVGIPGYHADWRNPEYIPRFGQW
jgi:glucarate dehydratase